MELVADDFYGKYLIRKSIYIWRRNLLLTGYSRFIETKRITKLQKLSFHALKHYVKYRTRKKKLGRKADRVYLASVWDQLRGIYLERKAQCHYNATLVQSAFKSWRQSVVGKASTREKAQVIVSNRAKSTLETCFRAWITYTHQRRIKSLWRLTAEHFYRQHVISRVLTMWKHKRQRKEVHNRAIFMHDKFMLRKILFGWKHFVKQRNRTYHAFCQVVLEKKRDHFQYWRRQTAFAIQQKEALSSADAWFEHCAKKRILQKWRVLALQHRGVITVLAKLERYNRANFAKQVLRQWLTIAKYKKYIRRAYRAIKMNYYFQTKEQAFIKWHRSFVIADSVRAVVRSRKRRFFNTWLQSLCDSRTHVEKEMLLEAKYRLAIVTKKQKCFHSWREKTDKSVQFHRLQALFHKWNNLAQQQVIERQSITRVQTMANKHTRVRVFALWQRNYIR